MKFTKFVAVVAVLGMASQSHAYSDGTLRRTTKVLKLVEEPQAQTEPVQIIERQAVQPVTVVEAAPVVDSRAETLRKARQNAEVQTEQKIVEKLEEARLLEEQERAKKIFGQTEGGTTATPEATPSAAPVVLPSTPVAAPAAPVAPAPVTPVVVEKVEAAPVATAPSAAPGVESKVEVAETTLDAQQVSAEPEFKDRIYVGALVGTVGYSAQNVRNNGALGVVVGLQVKPKWALEASYVHSNHDVVSFWSPNLYREMNQNAIGVTAKYEFLFGRLKPFLGLGTTYIYRTYGNRVLNNTAFFVNAMGNNEQTHALNLNLVGGVEFEVFKNISLGAGFDWSTNLVNNNGINFSDYGLPDNSRMLEDMDMISFLITAKYTF